MMLIISHSLMVHAKVSKAYIHFDLMYTADHIFSVLPIKYLINKDGEPNMPFKLATGTKTSGSYLHVLFCTCVVWKATSHIYKKALNMRHQAQNGFCNIFVEITQHQKGYLVYVPSTRNIISSYDVVFDESFPSTLEYTSQPYAEAIAVRMDVSCTLFATSFK